MIRHASLSPFRLSAASAISNLKSITSKTTPLQQVAASATKRRKLSLPTTSSLSATKGPDSDLKAAASALTVLAASHASRPCASTTSHDVRRVLLPKDVNERQSPATTAATLVTNSAATTLTKANDENVTTASFHIGKPPLRASAQPSSKPTAAVRSSVPPPHPFQSQTSNSYPSMAYYSSSMHAQKPHQGPRDYTQPHYPPLPGAHGCGSTSNPGGWTWPMTHSQSLPAWPMYPTNYQRHHYHQAAAAAPHVTSDSIIISSSSNRSAAAPYAMVPNQQSTFPAPSSLANPPPHVDVTTLNEIEGLRVRHEAKEDREWTSEDDHRLAQLVSDYRNRSRSGAAATGNNKRSFDALVEASAGAEEEPSSTTKEDALEETTEREAPTVDDLSTAGVAAKVVRRKRTTWTEDEDKELARVVHALKAKMEKICWSTVMKMMPGRDSKQCRDRYLNHLDSDAIHNKCAWSEDEDRLLLKFIKKHGTRWRLMQTTVLPKRTELTIKNRWNSAMKRRYTRFLSKRWGVGEDNIRLLTSRGLLNPGVDIEQMLRVARCKMIDVAYNVGDVESSRVDIVAAATSNGADLNGRDDVSAILEKYERSTDVSKRIHLRVIMGKMAEVDSANAPIGVMETLGVNSFAYLRSYLVEKFRCLESGVFRFSVNHLGILTLKQEIDLGPIGAVLRGLATGEGTVDDPFELLVVD